ncbi:MAG: hypothetical protein ACRECO_18385 [Xanthobacteraceae bacterium]
MTAGRKVPTSKSRRNGVGTGLVDFARTLRTLADPYRPELHYMRGPGPKWHAKHDRSAAPEAPRLAGLARIKG